MSASQKTLEQQRAAHAWKAVEVLGALKEKEQFSPEAGRELKRLPVRVMTSGLAPALAFLDAKEKKGIEVFVGALDEWIRKRRPGKPGLLDRLVHGDAGFLRFATAELLAYLQWLVRFAEARGLLDKEN